MKDGTRRKKAGLTVCAMLASAALCAQAQNPPPAAPWLDAGHVELNVSDASGEFAAAWQFDRADNGDVRIVKQERRGAAKVDGMLLSVCNDHALLFKDIVPARRREMQELDEPVLYLQLALRLLARAVPQGPQAVSRAETALDVSEDKTAIRVRKGNTARRDYAAPWRVRGTVGRDGEDGIRFDLAFSYIQAASTARRDEMKLSGTWRQKSRASAFDDAYPIPDWQVYRVDTVVNFVGGNAQLDPFLVPQPLRFKTLGELRMRIERVWDESPGAPKQMDCKL